MEDVSVPPSDLSSPTLKCPSCGQTLSELEGRCAHCGFEMASPEALENAPEVPRGVRLAGVLFIVLAVVRLLSTAVSGIGDEPVNPIGPAVMDIWVGLSLARGKRRLLGFAKFRVIAGAVVYSGLFIARNDMVSLVVQLAVSLAFCALLFGDAGRTRRGLASVTVGAAVCLMLLGIQQELTGRNLLVTTLNHLRYRSEGLDGQPVHGRAVPYTIGPLPRGWRLVSREQTRRETPAADLWFVQPSLDAGILVIPENLEEGRAFDMDLFQQAIVDGLGKKLTGEVTTTSKAVELDGHTVRIVDITGRLNGIEMHFRVGLFLRDGLAIQVVCFASERVFPTLDEDFQRVIESVTIEPGPSVPTAKGVPSRAVAA